jgi:hypothetical protein
MFGPCKVCLEKDKTLAVLRDEVTFLRKQIARPEIRNAVSVEYEADGLLSGQQDQIEIQTRQEVLSEEDAAILAERDAILNGSY